MTDHASTLSPESWEFLDAQLKRVDEDRWLSSRYADDAGRRRLVALYSFVYELARVRLVTSEPALASIRFQWWRDAFAEIGAGKPVRQMDTLRALVETGQHLPALESLIDGYETALEAGDRALEPEGAVMRLAAGLLGATGWAGFDALAADYARARRGAGEVTVPGFAKVPPAIRPAMAHAALRRTYRKSPDPTPFARRWAVLKAMVTGKV